MRGRRSCYTGFTLVELMVSLSVFTFVIFISLGSFLSVINSQRKAASLQIGQENLRFSLEFMIKEIRTGWKYYCGIPSNLNNFSPQDCAGGAPSFTFINAYGDTIVYRISNNQLERIYNKGLASSYISSSDIVFKSIVFFVLGSLNGDLKQPRVTITAEVEAGEKEPAKSVLRLQTTVSQRSLDS